jgi:hypothetical protein
VSCLVRTRDTLPVDGQYRDKMEVLDRTIREELPPVAFEYEHLFAHGTYTRVMSIDVEPGTVTVITGKIHKESCINILVKGHMQVATPDGTKDIHAPAWFVSEPGVQKAAVVFEPSVWINVVPNEDNAEDVELIEHRVTYESYEALEHDLQLKLEEQ